MYGAKSEGKWDYVFLFSNTPTPRMLDKVRLAVMEGRQVVVMYNCRTLEVLKVEDVQGCDLLPRKVTYRSVDFKRLLSIFTTPFWLRRNIFRYVFSGCQVFTDSLDLLAMGKISSLGKRCVFRHQIRDLHSLQIDRGLISRIIMFVERLLLRGVDMLVLTCDKYYKEYYARIYRGKYVVVENWPTRRAWEGFQRKPSSEFVVGFIGVVRYLSCLKALVDTISKLRARGLNIRLKVAGGGELEEFKAYCNDKLWIEIQGAFSYQDRIKEIYEDVDLNYSVYDSDIPNVRHAMPNKFYESVISRTPIVVAKGTYLEKRVLQLGIGTSVPHLDVDTIAEVLEMAYFHEGWYQEALQNLNRLDPDDYFVDAHKDSIMKAVLG